ncbi:MAG: PQQ-like beta-propeller repeat protein [Sedimentisphaerales bacterium]|nr:PQQ-like beta-propeller repeat protein [Sedimentisphaerales bacterium]
MRKSVIADIIPMAVAAAGVFCVAYLWISADAAPQLEQRVPIASNVSAESAGEEGDVLARAELTTYGGTPSELPGVWPHFRGPDRDAIGKVDVTLSRSWSAQGPPVLWSLDLGEGYAGAAVLGGRVFVADYDQDKQGDAIRCFSLADGQEIWRYFYPVKVKRNHGMSRTVPAVTDQSVVTIGPKCHVTCLDAATGELKWFLDLVKDYGAKVPNWYAGQCPLVEEGKVILGVGGEALMIAVDLETGQVLWRTANPRGWQMTHSSIVPIEFAGRRMYVWCASGGVVGVAADDGTLLWEVDEWQIRMANVPTPLPVGDGRILFSGDYNAGAMMLALSEENGQIVAKPEFRLEPQVFGSPQHTPILYEGHIYGIRPDKQLVCLDLEGNVVWTSGSDHTFGLGPYTIVNGLIYLLDDHGLLTLAEAQSGSYVQLAQAQVLHGIDAWGPMAVAENRLIVRDLTKMVCLDIAAQ